MQFLRVYKKLAFQILYTESVWRIWTRNSLFIWEKNNESFRRVWIPAARLLAVTWCNILALAWCSIIIIIIIIFFFISPSVV